ncbi:tRNA (adenosine(37)-N6)-threonylcarbamoyltransferase complex dimerization subunit type 1 TsaB [Paenirhodobacter sp. CAU 1674]|uniref:tRNA (adenosine(37)-N6)-threonylcarbamoyltransferase complex dimerization subunit type 1 TsaB n=1 Tax=Paenirhodobacter sp. CAU 1674 TaxID=3032596 RepID=UPI0023DAAE5F|nr:tRNA (adenosine(37)-N6)-threonylcarbamoyltransferase complex dimerization subunit type 1 TsaB [Paenirhodobacter sp. CAU 1674]MDF2140644.1 tRNA (adenosine(37)-N6)-threonylcarbamoyltransferase complex dimerization subunit type 1 TsaB [Paenirhodobacter sp. CAU 1674]
MQAKRWTLGFDTSAAHCAAALLHGERLIEARAEDMPKGQAERLMPLLDEMLARAGIGWRDLAVIGVGIGPGNFTGVRISVSAARGLALALGIPAVGVSTLDALAAGQPRPLRAQIDARRDEVYVQDFTATGADAPQMMPRAQADAEAAQRHMPLREGIAPAELATAIARLAAARADTPQPRPAPLYLRSADAAPPSDPPPVILD